MDIKKKIAATAATIVTAAGVVVTSVFSSPADLVNGGDLNSNVVIESVMEEPDAPDSGVDDEDSGDEKKKGIRNLIRQQILKIPAVIRVMVGLPLWALGWGAITAMSAIWSQFLSPIAGTVLGWICIAAALLAVGIVVIKALFPDVPLRKILIKENVSFVFFGTLCLAVLCAILPFFWESYSVYENLIKLLGGFAILGTLAIKVKFGPDSYDRVYTY